MPTRVAHVIARMNVGGPAVLIANLLENLDPNLYKTILLVGQVAPDEADYLAGSGTTLEIRRIEGLGRRVRVGSDLSALRSLRQAIHEFRPDIVHTHTAKAGVLGRIAAHREGVHGVVHTYHGHLLQGYFRPSVTRGIVGLERWLAARTSVLVSVGERVRDDLMASGIGTADQYVVVQPGLSPMDLPTRDIARRALNLPDVPVVSFVGRLTGIKRPDRLVEVASEVGRQREVVFLVVGDGDLAAAAREQARRCGAPVRFLGWRSDMATVYAASDLLMLTSDNEGMPVTLVEGAWCGVPAVTTAVGSAPEVVAHGVSGFVTGRSSGALAEAVLALVDDPGLRRRMGRAARGRAEEYFSISAMVSATDAVYRRALEKPSPANGLPD